MDSGLESRTYREHSSCLSDAGAYWEFSADSAHIPYGEDYGVGVVALLMELLRAIVCPRG